MKKRKIYIQVIEKNTNKELEFLQPNKIYKNNINKNYSNKRDYSNFDWTSLYANKFQKYEADIIRSGIDKKLNLDLYQDKMDLYDFYNIGDIYREEFRNE